jgi:hypothetical protein
MITRTKLVIGTLAAGLALAACGTVAGTAGQNQGNHARPLAQHQAQRAAGVDQLTELGNLKRAGVDQLPDLANLKRANQEAGRTGEEVRVGSAGAAEARDLAAVKRDLQRTAANQIRGS